MREFLRARIRWLGFWPLALLALPGCSLDASGNCGAACSFNTNPGPLPRSGTIFCDIEKLPADQRECATDDQINSPAIRMAAGAEALVTGQNSTFGLDYRAPAQAHCGAGRP